MTLVDYFGDWLNVINIKELEKIISAINYIYKRKIIVPNYSDIFKAFTLCSLHDCKVVFLGQDPYPQKDIATGIAFGNKLGTINLSPSLQVIKNSVLDPYEVFDETLESWGKQGILMLNSALTCEVNNVGSHIMLWRPFMVKLLQNMSSYDTGLVYVLLGSQAQTFEPYIGKNNHILKHKHPTWYVRNNTPLPSSIFDEINKILINNYGTPIKWCADL
jgi:uracil-DNA glycosylase